jgi:hypothetical protein
MEPRRDDRDLAAELRALRPAPRQEFAAELDAKAAARFPRRGGGPPQDAPPARLAARLRAIPPRRLLAPAGALALTAIVVATAVIVAVPGNDPDDSTGLLRQAAGEANGRAAPAQGLADAPSQGRAGTPDLLAQPSSGTQRSEARPGPYASRAGRRQVERSARIVLGAEPADVRGAAAKVFDAVRAADGIVLGSSVRDGAEGEAGAELELLIPDGKLGDALASLSAIGEVRSRRESTRDITAPTIGARERLQDSRARIRGLLVQLAAAATEDERAAVEAELRAERRRSAVLRSRLVRLRRRANLSRVSVRIETGAPAKATEDGAAWGVGDALDDAGRLLAVAAGVAVIGLAALAPLALLLLLAWLAQRAWTKASRARVLRRAT